ncbi:MAG: hypothetical protein TREMPRED_004171 [Tremellales sp. Tagirdzhanova-0007]|nr:MAG: hypothetical protein TREMPRED_004171 [Tremellales sp. Tagirdzhanova-0007]
MSESSPIAKRIPYGAHVIIIFTLAFTALILVVLVTFSSPFIQSINFLRLPSPTGATTFGSFGWCAPGYCLPNQIGYEYGTQVNRSLTGGMVIWAISIIFSFFTVLAILPLLFVHESRALRFIGNRTFFQFALNLATVTVTVAFLLSLFGWSIAHRAFQVAGISSVLGSAIWMSLAAAISVLMHVLSDLSLYTAADCETGIVATRAGGPGRGLPGPTGNGYYHYKRSTRQIIPR